MATARLWLRSRSYYNPPSPCQSAKLNLEASVMAKSTILESPLWEEFEQAARAHRRNPERLLAELMRERIEIWEAEELDAGIRRDVQAWAKRTGATEADAVEIVRQYRREKAQRKQATNSVGTPLPISTSTDDPASAKSRVGPVHATS